MNRPPFSKSACVRKYCNGLFPAALYTHMYDTRGSQVRTTSVQVQSVQTSERLRECEKKLSLLLPLHNIIFFVNLSYVHIVQVAMTYCVELFLCMVLGLAIGHAIFNSSSPVCRITHSHLQAYLVTSVADPGLSRIQVFPSRIQGQKDSGSASRNLSILNPKNSFLALGYMIRDVGDPDPPDLDFDSLPIPDPGFRGEKCNGSRFRIRNIDGGSMFKYVTEPSVC